LRSHPTSHVTEGIPFKLGVGHPRRPVRQFAHRRDRGGRLTAAWLVENRFKLYVEREGLPPLAVDLFDVLQAVTKAAESAIAAAVRKGGAL